MSSVLPLPIPSSALTVPSHSFSAGNDPTTSIFVPPSQCADRRQVLSARSRLAQLCKDGRPDLARRLFDALPRPAPTVLWNTLLIGFVCNAMPEEALHLYFRMNNDVAPAPRPDHYTYSSALKACADSRQLRLGKSIHCRIIRSLPTLKNRVLSNSLLNMYAACVDNPRSDIVCRAFKRMPKRNVVSWNTLIAWLVKVLRPYNALETFRDMVVSGIKPSTVSFVNVFPAVSEIEEKRIADALYGMIYKFGDGFANDMFVLSSVICVYSELSDIICARRLFNCAVEKNVEVWNTMIGGYIQNESPEEALILFTEILGSSDVVLPDNVTFLAAIMAVSQLQTLTIGQQIHSYIIKEKCLSALPVILLNALMVMYSRCASVDDAFKLFDQMPKRDTVTWNTMISAFIQNGHNFEGLLLAYQMQKEGFTVDSVTITALLSAASDLGDIRIGRETHGYLIRHELQCEGLTSYLIDMYSKSGYVEVARRLFDKELISERDQVTWNAMISGYTQSGQLEEAISIFQMMLNEKQTPNTVTLSSILPACDPIGGARSGKQIHAFAIRHLLDGNVFVGTALVDMYSKCGIISYAEKVFQEMDERNSVTYTTMISGLGQHGMGDRALSLFRMMQESGMKPDTITLVAVMAACSYAGLVDEGLEIYESIEAEFRVPEHHCCVVDMLGRAGRVEEAYKFVLELGERGNVVGVWGSLLAACKVHRKFELAKIVAEQLFELEKTVNQTGYHVLLSNVYAAERKWENVDRLRKQMRDKGLNKDPGSSWIEIGDMTHRFLARDPSNVQNDQIHEMLVDLASETKLEGYNSCIIDEFIDDNVLLE